MVDVPVTDDNLRYVLTNLWPRGVQELALLGLTRDTAFTQFRQYARGYKSRVLEHEGVPVVAVGIDSDEGGAFTWFQATEAFETHASAITRYIRREAKAYHGPLSIYSVCVHPATERWFRVLGFDRNSTYARALPHAVLYRFDRR